jgi:hypothetical protein
MLFKHAPNLQSLTCVQLFIDFFDDWNDDEIDICRSGMRKLKTLCLENFHFDDFGLEGGVEFLERFPLSNLEEFKIWSMTPEESVILAQTTPNLSKLTIMYIDDVDDSESYQSALIMLQNASPNLTSLRLDGIVSEEISKVIGSRFKCLSHIELLGALWPSSNVDAIVEAFSKIGNTIKTMRVPFVVLLRSSSLLPNLVGFFAERLSNSSPEELLSLFSNCKKLKFVYCRSSDLRNCDVLQDRGIEVIVF